MRSGRISAVRRAYKILHEAGKPNWPSPEAPFVIVVQHDRWSGVWAMLHKSDGYTFPNLGYHQDWKPHSNQMHQGHCFGRKYVGGGRSRFVKDAPYMIQYRDTMNLIHTISQKRAKVTEEQVKAITDPNLRIKLLEAVCLAAA